MISGIILKDRQDIKRYHMQSSIIQDFQSKVLACFVLVLVQNSLYGNNLSLQKLSYRMDSVAVVYEIERQSIEQIKKEQELLEKSLFRIDEQVARHNESVSNQIAASAHVISTWGWIFTILSIALTIAGIGFGYYVNIMRKRIKELTSEAKQIREELSENVLELTEQQQRISTNQEEINNLQQKIKEEAQVISQNIEEGEKQIKILQELTAQFKENSRKIYTHLRNEETKMLIERLVQIPEDIFNISKLLLSRELSADAYGDIYTAYQKLIARGLEAASLTSLDELRLRNPKFNNAEHLYALIFTQHFLDQAIQTPVLSEYIQSQFGYLCGCFYRNDAEKCTEDLKRGISSFDVKGQINVLVRFIIALSSTQFKAFKKLYQILMEGLEINALQEIWTIVSSQVRYADTFAQCILDRVEILDPKHSIIADIKAYIASSLKNPII